MNAIKITLYTTPTCHYCQIAREYFTEKGITYQEYDVSKDSKIWAEMIEKSGQMGVPVIIIGDTLLLGFERDSVERVLKELKRKV